MVTRRRNKQESLIVDWPLGRYVAAKSEHRKRGITIVIAQIVGYASFEGKHWLVCRSPAEKALVDPTKVVLVNQW